MRHKLCHISNLTYDMLHLYIKTDNQRISLDMYKSAVDDGAYANGVKPPVERSASNYARNLRLINS